jgi:hypothetical protein
VANGTRFREQFPLSRDYIHIAAFLLASHPKSVREAIERHLRALDGNPALAVEPQGRPTPLEQNARVVAAAARYLGAHFILGDVPQRGDAEK